MDAAQQSALQQVAQRVWLQRGLLAYLLWPVAALFALLVVLRRALYRVGVLRVRRVGVPVIVVGNVVAGGAGKTPAVIALVQHLHQRGLRVGVVSRGHGRRTRDCREVLESSAAVDVGDEPALIKRNTAASVFVAADRHEAAQALLRRHPGTDMIICDDGLQHLGLHRDLEICVFDDRGVGNGFLLPAGPLREPWPRAVDLLLHTGTQPAFAGYTARRALGSHASRADGSRVALTELAHLSAKPLLAVAAIARPEDFFAMLRQRGLTLAKTLALPDHHDFADWSGADCADHVVICTEKDAVKLWTRQADALAVPLQLTPEPAFLTKLDAIIGTWTHDC